MVRGLDLRPAGFRGLAVVTMIDLCWAARLPLTAPVPDVSGGWDRPAAGSWKRGMLATRQRPTARHPGRSIHAHRRLC